MADLATAYVRLVPSLKGAQSTIANELGGVDTHGPSEKIGGSLSEGIGGKIKAAGPAIGAALGAAVLAGATAAVAGITALGKQALDAYASYEQLAGGVDKLFGESSEKLKQYAQDAYKTAGMSANDYMQQVTSFSAALINSLGGDTAAAADQADRAMRLISDNVNTFGTDAASVQQAIQGLSRENFTMLDNLKLGYAGTKEGMEQLIADANAYAESIGLAGNLSMDSFSDMITAIDLIQQKQGIAGTTAKEAMGTIEGSIQATAAAWANLLTEFGKDDADIGARIDELLESGFAALENIAPRVVTIVEHIVEALPMAIEKMQPYLDEIVAIVQEFADTHQEEIKAAAEILFDGIVAAIATTAQLSMAATGELIAQVISTFPEWAPKILEAAVILFVNILQGLINVTVDILNGVAGLIGQVLLYVADAAEPMLENAERMWDSFVQGIQNTASDIASAASDAVQGAADAVGGFLNDFYNAGADLVSGLVSGISDNMWAVLDTITGGLSAAVDEALRFLGIASPSKLFRWVGQMTMDGMAQGIADGAKNAQREMLDAATGLYGVVGGGNYALGGMQPAQAALPSGTGGDVLNFYIYTRDGEDVAARIRNELHAYNLTRGR